MTLVLEPTIKLGSLEEEKKEVDMLSIDLTEASGIRLLEQLSKSVLMV